ncbi:MAG: hypothetical protein M0Z53_02510 [Thermaerobacter sp.]|nr:hypothetical protein [Thermaerobacter sp.]
MKKSMGIILAAAAAVTASVPVFAHGGTHGGPPASLSLPSQATASHSAQSGPPSSLPSQASGHSSHGGPPSNLPSQAAQGQANRPSGHGQSASVLAAVQQLHQYRTEIQAERQTFAANMKTMGQALNQAVQAGNPGAISTVTSELKTIVTALAQAVRSYHAGLTSLSATSTAGGSASAPAGLTNAVAMFKAESTALATANTDLTQLIAQLSASGGTQSTSPSSSASSSP